MKNETSTDQLLQDLQLLVEYLLAVRTPDPGFLRMHTELLLERIDDLEGERTHLYAA